MFIDTPKDRESTPGTNSHLSGVTVLQTRTEGNLTTVV